MERRAFLKSLVATTTTLTVFNGSLSFSTPTSALSLDVPKVASRSNSLINTIGWFDVGDTTGTGVAEFLLAEGRCLYTYQSDSGLAETARHHFPAAIRQVMVGYFGPATLDRPAARIMVELETGELHIGGPHRVAGSMGFSPVGSNTFFDGERWLVGDFDGDGYDEILAVHPQLGSTRRLSWNGTSLESEVVGLHTGETCALVTPSVRLLAGQFGSGAGSDLIMTDAATGTLAYFRSSSDNGRVRFDQLLVSEPEFLGPDDQVRLLNLTSADKADTIVCWRPSLAVLDFYHLEAGGGESSEAHWRHQGRVGSGPLTSPNQLWLTGFLAATPDQGEGSIVVEPDRLDLFASAPAPDRDTDPLGFSAVGRLSRSSAQAHPWLVILAAIDAEPPRDDTEARIRTMFEPGSGGLVDYWHDVTLGHVDISGSVVSPWVPLELAPDDDMPITIDALVEQALIRVSDTGQDPGDFAGHLLILSRDLAELEPHSAVVGTTMVASNQSQSGTDLAHLMARALGLEVDRSYHPDRLRGDPYSIMSAPAVKSVPRQKFDGSQFGPAISVPHLAAARWLAEDQILRPGAQWLADMKITFELGAVDDRTSPSPVGATLDTPSATSRYQLEYLRSHRWNAGVDGDHLLIRLQTEPSEPGAAEPAVLVADLKVPSGGNPVSFLEPAGGVKFTAQRADDTGRLVAVTAAVAPTHKPTEPSPPPPQDPPLANDVN